MNRNLGNGSSAGWAKRLGWQFVAFVHDDTGVTAIEYALLGALIALVIVAAVGVLGLQVQAMWTVVSDAVEAVVS